MSFRFRFTLSDPKMEHFIGVSPNYCYQFWDIFGTFSSDFENKTKKDLDNNSKILTLEWNFFLNWHFNNLHTEILWVNLKRRQICLLRNKKNNDLVYKACQRYTTYMYALCQTWPNLFQITLCICDVVCLLVVIVICCVRAQLKVFLRFIYGAYIRLGVCASE